MEEKKDVLIDLQLKPVIGEYRGLKLEFYPLSSADTIEFLDAFTSGSTFDFLSGNSELMCKFIASSLRTDIKNIRGASVGFLVFAMNKILEAVDFDFFVKGSQELMQKIDKVASVMGISKEELKELEKRQKQVTASSEEKSQISPEEQDGHSTK